MWKPDAPFGDRAYGMGWIISDGGKTVAHGGDYFNYSTFMLAKPSEGIGVVVLTNLGSILDMEMPETIAKGVAALVQGEQPQQVNSLWMWLIPALMALWALKNLFDLITTPRWWLRSGQEPTSRFVTRICLPNLARLVLAALLLLASSLLFGVKLPFLIILQPDVGYLVVINAVLLSATAVTRLALYLKNRRQGLAA